jgi:hypothetical protein
MDDNAVTGAMQKLYPAPKPTPQRQQIATTPANMALQAAGPALDVAQKYLVDPFNKMAEWGGKVGRETGTALAAGYEDIIGNPLKVQPEPGGHYGHMKFSRTPLESQQLAEKEHPALTGLLRATGEVAGGAVGDPRNWPFLASGAARPLLQKVMARGFATQMGSSTLQGVKEIHDNWDRMSPAERWEAGSKVGITGVMTGLSAREGFRGKEKPIPTQTPVPPEANVQSPAPKAAEPTPTPFVDKTEPSPSPIPGSPEYEAVKSRLAELESRPTSTKKTQIAEPEQADYQKRSLRIIGRDEKGNPITEVDRASQPTAEVMAFRGRKRFEEASRLLDKSLDEGPITIGDKTYQPADFAQEAERHLRTYARYADLESIKGLALNFQDKAVEFQKEGRLRYLASNSINNNTTIFNSIKNKEHIDYGKYRELYGKKTFDPVVPQTIPDSFQPIDQSLNPVERQQAEKLRKQAWASQRMDAFQATITDPEVKASLETATPRQRLFILKEQSIKQQMLESSKPFFAQARKYSNYADILTKAKGFNVQDLQNRFKLGEGSPTRETSISPQPSPQTYTSPEAGRPSEQTERPTLTSILQKPSGSKLNPEEQKIFEAYYAEGATGKQGPLTQEADAHILHTMGIAPARSTGFLGRYETGPVGENAYWGIRRVRVMSKEADGTFTVKLPGGDIKRGMGKGVLSQEPNTSQAGFLRVGNPPPPPPRPVPTNAIQELTRRIDDGLKDTAEPSQAKTEKLVDSLSAAKDKVTENFHQMLGGSRELWEKYKNPPQETDFKSAIGKWQGSLQRNAFDLKKFTDSIKEKFPDKLRREAITNWIQANGDPTTLEHRANTSTEKFKKGYELAQNLTPEEKELTGDIRQYFDQKLDEAIKGGLLEDGVSNYVNQIWSKPNAVSLKLMGDVQRSILKPDPAFLKRRVHDSYFEGEQAGLIPRDKDIGYLLSTYEQSFNTALASRSLIHEFTNGSAKDGRPIVSPSGGGRAVPDDEKGPDAYLINPRRRPEETGDYQPVDHPALRKWTWATKDESGKPIFVKGDLLIHPDHYNHLKNVLGTSALRKNLFGRSLLQTSGFVKGTFLVGPFHQVQEGIHAIFHRVSPFNPDPIDFNDPIQSKLIDGGLMIADYHAQQEFAEGASTSGLWAKLPGIGPLVQRYNEYLFQDYIPRLKMAMAKEAFIRNSKRYPDLSDNQLHQITANQANAAFGELNYKMLGRNKTVQDVLRLTLLAPDFLEARTRFAAQGMKPFGQEQSGALLRGALGMYLAARVLNKVNDDDYHFDQPFGLVAGKHVYTLRSLPGDIYHLVSDPRSFIYHRLNPFTTRPLIEGITGRDDFGRRKGFGEQTMDLAKTLVPLPAQGFLNKYGDTSVGSTLTESAGIRRDIYRTPAASLAHKFAMSHLPMDFKSRGLMQIANKIQDGSYDPMEVQNLVAQGKLSPKDIMNVFRYAKEQPIVRDFKGLQDLGEAAQVYSVANDKEKALISRDFAGKMTKLRTLSPERQKEALEYLQKIKFGQ